MAKRQIPLATPGEILLEEFLKPLDVTQYRLAKEIGVPQRRIGEIVAGKRAITADTAARLGVYFGIEAEFWLNLQAHYDLALTRETLADNLTCENPAVAVRAAQIIYESSTKGVTDLDLVERLEALENAAK